MSTSTNDLHSNTQPNSYPQKHLLLVVNSDAFLVSHRLSMAQACLEDGYRVSIATKYTIHYSYLQSLGFHLYHFPVVRGSKSPFQNCREIMYLRKLYQEINPDLIHHVGIRLILLGSIARLAQGKSIILNAVAGLGSALSHKKVSALKWAFYFCSFIFRKSYQHFLFQNEQNAEFFQKLLSLETKQINFIKGTGIDIAYFDFAPEYPTAQLKVCLIARMLKDKGVFDFIEAAKILRRKWEGKAVFELIGPIDTENPSSISQKELEANVDNSYIMWKGPQYPILPFLQSAHIIVLPSYHEGFPRVLLEASSVGRAIISSDCEGCKALIKDQKNGIIVPIGDIEALAKHIDFLLENPSIRQYLGKNARQVIVDNYTDSYINLAFIELYHRLLCGK